MRIASCFMCSVLLTSVKIPCKTHKLLVSFYDVLRSVFSEATAIKPRFDFFPEFFFIGVDYTHNYLLLFTV